MGFIGRLVGGLIIQKVLGNAGSSNVQMPKVEQRASDILPSTTSETPESPILGNQTTLKGRKQLKINRQTQQKGYNPTNI